MGIGGFFGRVCAWFKRMVGRRAASPRVTRGGQMAVASVIEPGTAVAGYLKRVDFRDRGLAARLRSTAEFNVRKGRKPWRPVTRVASAPPRPKARLGGRKQRAVHHPILARATRMATAQIVQFPAAAARSLSQARWAA